MPSKLEIGNQKLEIVYRPLLHAVAVLFVVLTFCLIVLGGMVTSRGAGLSVPDWPTSYHYNMFLFPPSMWTGGILYEHTHRLMGTVVGFVSIIIAVMLWRTQAGRPWLRWFGAATLVMVIIQGVMGGLRVTEISTFLALVHGITGQIFLCMTVVIAAATNRWWIAQSNFSTPAPNSSSSSTASPPSATSAACGLASAPLLPAIPQRRPSLRALSILLLTVLLIQLTLGAAVRHTGSGLAIPDFPSSYGHLIPPLDQVSLNAAVNRIPYDQFTGNYTTFQVGLQFAHRLWALAVILTALWVVTRFSLAYPNESAVTRPAVVLVGLLILQVMLGAAIIWTGRHPAMATAHQATGAAILATAALLTLRVGRAHRSIPPLAPAPAQPTNSDFHSHENSSVPA